MTRIIVLFLKVVIGYLPGFGGNNGIMTRIIILWQKV
jgi:hypothetical protein